MSTLEELLVAIPHLDTEAMHAAIQTLGWHGALAL
jgi:hypothetical protein